MIVRFGFVAMSVMLEHASPSRTMTYSHFSKLPDREAAIRKLERITEENLHNALRVLRHAFAHDIKVYRFSSKIIPLSTHEELAGWDPLRSKAVRESFDQVGAFVRDKGLRVSFHPDHFCVLNTPKPDVLAKSVADLDSHVGMLEAMGLGEEAKCNIHVGGAYGDKKAAGERFIAQFAELDKRYRSRITLENDDKTFTALETLEIAEAASVPMVLDIHHHAVNDGGMDESALTDKLWPGILETWDKENRRLDAAEAAMLSLPPKLHASSPRSGSNPKAHADHVEMKPLLRFLQSVAGSCQRIDVMLEAKRKDEALMVLMEEFQAAEGRGENVRVVDGAAVEISG
jgi:UV DNA damage endonuclease